MITLIAVPKPFIGHIDIIQKNAIRSWVNIKPDLDIILLGDEEGIKDTADHFGLRHIPVIEKNEFGTPLFNSAIDIAQKTAKNEVLCFINSDIVLLPDFIPAVRTVLDNLEKFLIIGQRIDLDVLEPLDFDSHSKIMDFEKKIVDEGCLHIPDGMDYFIFNKNTLGDIPSFSIGRPRYDNWMVYNARLNHIPVINATNIITAVHQNHDYSNHPLGRKGIRSGVESQRNMELLGSIDRMMNVNDANNVLTSSGIIKPPLSLKWIRRELYVMQTLHPVLNLFFKPFNKLRSMISI